MTLCALVRINILEEDRRGDGGDGNTQFFLKFADQGGAGGLAERDAATQRPNAPDLACIVSDLCCQQLAVAPMKPKRLDADMKGWPPMCSSVHATRD